MTVTNSNEPFRVGYRPELDGVRAFAVMAVMCFHAFLPFASGGFIGVDVFFVLSGFLITALLCEEWRNNGTVSLRRFYLRRALRLLPALVLLLTVCDLFVVISSPDLAIKFFRASVISLFYVANWAVAFDWVRMYAFLHTWSLSIEEQFYVLWPILLIVMLRMRVSKRVIAAVAVAGIIAAIATRAVLWSHHVPYARVYAGLDTRGDALLTGCLIGLLASWNWLPSSRLGRRISSVGMVVGMVVLAAFVVVLKVEVPYVWYIPYGITPIASGLMLVGLLVAPIAPLNAILRHPTVVWIGRLSYGLYLWHYPIFIRSEAIIPREQYGWIAFVVPAALSFAAAAASFYLLERPLLRLKNRIGIGRVPADDSSVQRMADGPIAHLSSAYDRETSR